MKLFFLFVLLIAACANADTFTTLADFDTAATNAGATAAKTLADGLDSRFQASCVAGVSYDYTTSFSGSTQTLSLPCAVGTDYDGNTSVARLQHWFQIGGSCLPGDTLSINTGPGVWLVC